MLAGGLNVNDPRKKLEAFRANKQQTSIEKAAAHKAESERKMAELKVGRMHAR